MSIGPALALLRKEHGKTQEDVAAGMGYSHSTTVSRLERPDSNPGFSKIERFLTAIDASWQQLAAKLQLGSSGLEADEIRESSVEYSLGPTSLDDVYSKLDELASEVRQARMTESRFREYEARIADLETRLEALSKNTLNEV